MIESKKAVEVAMQYAKDHIGEENLPHLLLEELEYDESSNVWKVVIGYDSHIQTKKIGSPLMGLGSSTETEKKREYKTLEIDGATGQCKRMKMY